MSKPKCEDYFIGQVCFGALCGLNSDIAPCPLCADFVAEVGDDEGVAAGANFF